MYVKPWALKNSLCATCPAPNKRKTKIRLAGYFPQVSGDQNIAKRSWLFVCGQKTPNECWCQCVFAGGVNHHFISAQVLAISTFFLKLVICLHLGLLSPNAPPPKKKKNNYCTFKKSLKVPRRSPKLPKNKKVARKLQLAIINSWF